jgi:hypothetical protein
MAVVSFLVIVPFAWPTSSPGHSPMTVSFSGEAQVVRASVLGTPIVLADTGPLPPSGGALEASLLTVSEGGVLTAEVLHAATIGQGDRTRSEASVANLSLTAGGNTISSDFLMARVLAVCTPGGPSVSGSSEIVNLMVNGQPVVVSGAPNQKVPLPLGTGTITINEQMTMTTKHTGDITVNALHIMITGVADVVISSAHADINCIGNRECMGKHDFVTGGGWITGPTGAKANFGVAGGIRNGAFWGHLTYIDHGSGGPKVKGTGVTDYVVVNTTTRHIEGTAEVNGQAGFTYKVDVSDNGEPGTNDTFALTLSNGYAASGRLGGGNIQIHKPCQ